MPWAFRQNLRSQTLSPLRMIQWRLTTQKKKMLQSLSYASIDIAAISHQCSHHRVDVAMFSVHHQCCFTCTVPFHSIRQSCVTGPSKMLKCHGCHGDFYGVLNSFGNHVSNIENFSSPAALNCWKIPKIWVCHNNFGRSPKPNFRQACHASRALPNWLKWYSISSHSPGWRHRGEAHQVQWMV